MADHIVSMANPPFETPEQKTMREFMNSPAERLRRQIANSPEARLKRNLATETAAKFEELGGFHKASLAALASQQTGALALARDYELRRVTQDLASQFARAAGVTRSAELQGTMAALAGNPAFGRIAEQAHMASETFSALNRNPGFGEMLAQTRVLSERASEVFSALNPAMQHFLSRSVEADVQEKLGELAEALTGEEIAVDEDTRTTIRRIFDALNMTSANPTWYDLLAVAMTIVTVISLVMANPDFTESDRASLEQTRDASVEMLGHIQSEVEAREQLKALPHAIERTRANVRQSPNGSAARSAVLVKDATVGILARAGRWYQVAYEAPLNHEIVQGWIWGDSLELINLPATTLRGR